MQLHCWRITQWGTKLSLQYLWTANLPCNEISSPSFYTLHPYVTMIDPPPNLSTCVTFWTLKQSALLRHTAATIKKVQTKPRSISEMDIAPLWCAIAQFSMVHMHGSLLARYPYIDVCHSDHFHVAGCEWFVRIHSVQMFYASVLSVLDRQKAVVIMLCFPISAGMP